jgi:hypothetical protein
MNNYRIFNKKEIFASIVFSVFFLLLPFVKASVVLNATANITSSGTMFYVGANGNGWVRL